VAVRRFEGKVVLVTGAASGIGRATVERMAEEGATLFCVDVDREGVEGTAKRAVELGVEAEARVCDVGDPEQVAATVRACVDRFGRLDSVCNVAGIIRTDNSHETSLEDWERVLRINLTGTFLMCRAAIPHLLATKGNIVNTSSTSALGGLPWGAAYAASKGGVLALTRALAVEYAKQGLRVNAVCPGAIKTPMLSRFTFPEGADRKLMARLMPLDENRGPETVASVIALLASEDGAHMNGEAVRVDGGILA
jgi:NAD(P)-dependent dehydrogenase (short-subunit alcohol dehydrogenase family)